MFCSIQSGGLRYFTVYKDLDLPFGNNGLIFYEKRFPYAYSMNSRYNSMQCFCLDLDLSTLSINLSVQVGFYTSMSSNRPSLIYKSM